MQAVMSLAEHVFVLAEGRIIAQGAPHVIAADPRVVEAYLGHGAAGRMLGAAQWLSCSPVNGLHAGYGATEILRGIDLAVNERRDRRGARLERRRQVHAQPRDLRRAAAVARRDPFRGRRPIERARPSADRVARPDPRAGRPAHLPQHDGRAKTSTSAATAARARAARAEPRARVRASFRASPSGSARAPARCRAASSRCSRSAAA